jgi:hypothetical protein
MADEEHRVPEINVENVRQARESTEHAGHAAHDALDALEDNQGADDDVPEIPTKTQPEAEPPIDSP